MAKAKQFEFFLLRYVPDPIKNEFVNVGVALIGEGGAELKFTNDWARVKCMDSDADIEMLEAIEQDLRARLQEAGSRDVVMKRIEESFSNLVQLSERKGIAVENVAEELENLSRMYLETAPGLRAAKESRTGGRARIRRAMQDAFQREGVWELMWKGIPAERYGRKGDPLKIDCGYSNGKVRLFHAVSPESEADTAKLLAFSYPDMRAGIERVEKKEAELTAVLDSRESDDETAFAIETLQRASIVIARLGDLGGIAGRARNELL